MPKKPIMLETTPDSLTVGENSGLTPIGIAAPTDSQYPSNKLTVKVTSLPSDGRIYLSDGVTPIYIGEKLTVSQLTSLLFKPTAGLFGTSSTFTYTVSDPSGTTASGSATLSIALNSLPPVTTTASLTVAENAAATSIGIAAPTDPSYSASQLTIKVTGLPTDGTVLLSDGVTAVYNGETLTVAQLTGLMFKPTAGAFGTSSTLTYSVTDPSGLSTKGTATLTIGPDTMPPVATLAALTVAENSAATTIGIVAPTDPNYAASQLTVTVTALPGDGLIFLSDGVTQVAQGAVLSVAQLTGLRFQPTAGIFNTSSAFTYTVTDPAGLSTTGSATLSIAADTQPPVTTDPILTVAPNSGATPIGIPAPTDPNYAQSQLIVTVTGLPSDGTVLLSDGVTPVSNGEALAVAQLTGLMFKPTAGLSGQSSDFTYTVTNPAGLSAGGVETLTISSSSTTTTGGVSANGSILMPGAGGSLVTSTGTWTYSQKTTGTIGGYDIQLNGQTVGNFVVEMEIANNGNLYVYTAPGAWYEWTGSVLNGVITRGWLQTTDPATSTASTSTNTTTSTTSTTANVAPMPPTLQPLSSGGIVRFALQNTQSTGLGAHEITFNQVFAQGQVPNGSQLYAVINGVSYAVQLDVKTSYADGSVKSGIITLDAPAIAAGTTLQGQLFLGSTSTAPAVDISKLPSSGYNFAVSLTLHNNDGTTTSYQLNAGTLLNQTLQAGKVSYWLQGPQATEVRFDVPISGSFHVTFDVTDFADGTTRTDVQFNNDYAEQPTGGAVTYDETITQNGSVVSQYAGITQYQYQTRHEVFWSNGAPQVNIVHDIAALEKTGAIPGYNLAYSSSSSQTLANYATQMAGSGWGGPLPVDGVDQYMPDTGGRPDVGPTTGPSALWLMTQNQTAAQYALGWADVAGSVPWHFYDPTTGNYLSVFQYSQLWTDPRGGNGAPGGLTQQVASSTLTGWTPDTAHQPDLSYVAYMLTGDRYYLDQLNAQADASILSVWPGSRGPSTPYDIVVDNGGTLAPWGGQQVRGKAWSLREIDEAAYANPDGSAEKAYFTQVSNDNWSWLVSQLPTWTAVQGEAYGQIQGAYGNNGSMAPWQQDYFASTAIEAAAQGNQNAKIVLKWEANFLVGRFLPHTGWNQHDGAAYNLQVYNTTTNSYYQTWGDIETASQAAGMTMNGTGWASGDYAELGLSTLAGIITVLGPDEPDAMQAYAWMLTSGAPYLTADPQFQISPKLPDGNFLYSNQIQIDTSNTNVTLTTTGGDSLLAVSGTGSDTLIGGTGTCDILFAGTSGNNTLKAGTGNDYMFGGFSGGTTTFVDNIGNNYMKGGTGTNIYQFSENASGHDTIANFKVTTDQLQIAANLNGNGITAASQLISSATVSNGNTVLHLSPNNDITLLGISTPSSLINSILVR